jgi:hypothetical protein
MVVDLVTRVENLNSDGFGSRRAATHPPESFRIRTALSKKGTRPLELVIPTECQHKG